MMHPISGTDLFANIFSYLESIDYYNNLLELETIVALEQNIHPHQLFTIILRA